MVIFLVDVLLVRVMFFDPPPEFRLILGLKPAVVTPALLDLGISIASSLSATVVNATDGAAIAPVATDPPIPAPLPTIFLREGRFLNRPLNLPDAAPTTPPIAPIPPTNFLNNPESYRLFT